jgi:hypothetical protein
LEYSIVLKIISIQEDYDNAFAAYDLLQTTYLNTLFGIASREYLAGGESQSDFRFSAN